ncbi:MAG: nickel-dependent hydrogenase large subunit [Calditrichaeota bacterium]|nr:MAG: nickel-dependent hydrogenase large subunit [Calditrichota bacterium]MBL1206883.1 nickel-dependent hydrogenase large subunit [Calditrichota bacterium]NOG46710.1 nickel-dependent hydrogenase large subunit [Calditrichota bacterium]
MARITIDPITRIEGHLRIDCEINNGKVTKAWSSGQMWRGIETILKGRDPRDAWLFTQRICGVCTTVHAIVSVRAVENALKMEIPLNAQYIRNIIMAAHALHDKLVHFYHLSALDWVDIVSALKGNPAKAAKLAQSLSPWFRNSKQEMKAVQQKLKGFVDSGQLGIFSSGYWGHPAMKLSPDVNLIAATHYMQAFEYQRKANQIVSILGSKTPHIQNLAVGGVANPINPDNQAALNMERLYNIKTVIDELGDFIKQVYVEDVCTVAAFYKDWLNYGKGIVNYLSVPEFPIDTKGTQFMHPGGYIPNANLGKFKAINSFDDQYFKDGVQESIKHSWYDGEWTRHPWQEETEPKYTNFNDNEKYSWVKSPTFFGEPAQVGPLANVLAMYKAGHEPTQRYTNYVLSKIGTIAGHKIPVSALHSTLGRHAARAVSCAVFYETLQENYKLLMANIAKGDFATFNKPEFPEGIQKGFGFHEAPRGTLSHWIIIENGKIKNYQCVVPSTWNSSPRNQNDEPGPYEASLVGNPVAQKEKPLEVLRTIHSFDPCLACAIHLHDNNGSDIVKVKAL